MGEDNLSPITPSDLPTTSGETITVPNPRSSQNWKAALLLSGGSLLQIAAQFFSNYLTTRGYLNVSLARFFLVISGAAISGLIALFAMAFLKKRKLVTVVCGIGLVVGTSLALEHWAPKVHVGLDVKPAPGPKDPIPNSATPIPIPTPIPDTHMSEALTPCPDPLKWSQSPLGIGPPYLRLVTVMLRGARGFTLFTNVDMDGLPELTDQTLAPAMSGSGPPMTTFFVSIARDVPSVSFKIKSRSRISVVCMNRGSGMDGSQSDEELKTTSSAVIGLLRDFAGAIDKEDRESTNAYWNASRKLDVKSDEFKVLFEKHGQDVIALGDKHRSRFILTRLQALKLRDQLQHRLPTAKKESGSIKALLEDGFMVNSDSINRAADYLQLLSEQIP